MKSSHSVGPRARDLFGGVGPFETGPGNSLTDVAGVRVGHTTLSDGSTIFTGATAIVIDGVSPDRPARANLVVGNGFGKFVGATQVQELGEVETPIVLTSTLSAFRAADALITWGQGRDEHLTSINPVVGEINDSWLSNHRARATTADHVLAAISSVSTAPVPLGNVGGGTGACALGFKSGIGSSSRVLDIGGRQVTVGALVQANMDGDLRVRGQIVRPGDFGLPVAGPEDAKGSCVVVIAVDAALDTQVLRRVASRGLYALARAGARFSHGSGDYCLAVSTSTRSDTMHLDSRGLTNVFEAAMDTVEESILDSLIAATTVETASGRVAAALPHRFDASGTSTPTRRATSVDGAPISQPADLTSPALDS